MTLRQEALAVPFYPWSSISGTQLQQDAVHVYNPMINERLRHEDCHEARGPASPEYAAWQKQKTKTKETNKQTKKPKLKLATTK